MHLPKTILVATDFSETSDRALDYAVDLAKLLGASITVMHAYELPVYGFPDGALVATVEIATRIMNAAQAALAQSCEVRADKGVKLTPILRQGVAYEEVHSVAEEINADLIVIGTHGRKGLSRALLGSVAEKVIRTATRPVLTITGPKGGEKKG
jgi:nucleotide-binding universal stress UspA family protein